MPKVKTARHFTCKRCANPETHWSGRRPEPRTITFPTSDGLDKHLREEHRSAMYSCTAVGCFKGTSAPKFQKPETLTQHIKESHTPDTIFSCPIDTCTFEPSKLDDIAMHAYWMDSRNHGFLEDTRVFSAVTNAATWMYFKCPVWNCRKLVSGGHKKISAHLLAHSPVVLDQVQSKLAEDGYELSPIQITGQPENSVPHMSSIWIKCPACETRCENDTKFEYHVEVDHMLATSPEVLEHFESWKVDLMSWCNEQDAKHILSYPCWLDPVSRDKDVFWLLSSPRRRKALKCSYPTCSFVSTSAQNQHPSFLRPAEDIAASLWPHRMRILRHYRRFLTYPMFEEHVPSPKP
jgi:hypothetical protein